MAVCGDKGSISVDGDDQTEAHIFNISSNAGLEDVTTFGAGNYGEHIGCRRDGSVDMSTYEPVSGLAPGGTADLVCNVAGQDTVTMGNCVCISKDVSIDAKAVVNWDYSFKITGDIAGDW